jgi:hypothetical protein
MRGGGDARRERFWRGVEEGGPIVRDAFRCLCHRIERRKPMQFGDPEREQKRAMSGQVSRSLAKSSMMADSTIERGSRLMGSHVDIARCA